MGKRNRIEHRRDGLCRSGAERVDIHSGCRIMTKPARCGWWECRFPIFPKYRTRAD